MDKIRNLSVRKTIFLYVTVSFIISMFLSAPLTKSAERLQMRIWWKYVDEDQYFGFEEKGGFEYSVSRPAGSEMTEADRWVSEFCDFWQTYAVLVLSIAGNGAAVLLFYRNKLKKPIKELEKASQNIARSNLDFCITYENKDEMGALCREFEHMRRQLEENNRQLWKNIEDEKELRAAVAHDIRSPLTVLKGYQEMLMEYLPNGTIDMDRAMEMLAEGMKQIERMDVFVETMRKISSLEKRELVSEQISAGQLEADIRSELTILQRTTHKQIELSVTATAENFRGDKEVILEVVENLLSNAVRYAKERVEILIQESYSELRIHVKDDGDGF